MEVTPTTENQIELCKQMVEEAEPCLIPLPKNLQMISCFTTFFASWRVEEEGLLVQLFPRAGREDTYFLGRWVKKTYVPGRCEQKIDGLKFPENFPKLLHTSASKVWMGNVKCSFVPELESYVLLFEGLMGASSQEGGLLDKFLEQLDQLLDVE